MQIRREPYQDGNVVMTVTSFTWQDAMTFVDMLATTKTSAHKKQYVLRAEETSGSPNVA
jgi:hypothetical protein